MPLEREYFSENPIEMLYDCNLSSIKSRRQRLEDRFTKECTNQSNKEVNHSCGTVLSTLSKLSTTRSMLRSSAAKISKTFSDVKTTLGSFSQKFRRSTKRRKILIEGPVTPICETPRTCIRKTLGRTPTKLYSPFGIESPVKSTILSSGIEKNIHSKMITNTNESKNRNRIQMSSKRKSLRTMNGYS